MASSRNNVPVIKPNLNDTQRLTPRDRILLAWLAEHDVLSTEHIDLALFGSRRFTQRRLTVLHDIGAVARISSPGDGTPGSSSFRYILGSLGLYVHPEAAGRLLDSRHTRPPKGMTDRLLRLAFNPRLNHLLGVNGFFAALHGHTRQHPSDGHLARWWSEQRATAAFTAYPSAAIRPDGHGVWSSDDRHTGFFLEHDTGSENLGRILDKLPAYERLARTGLRYPVLLHLHSTRREDNLLALLAEKHPALVVATAVHGCDPAEAVWALPGREERLRLADLPCDHGPATALNPARFHAPDDDR